MIEKLVNEAIKLRVNHDMFYHIAARIFGYGYSTFMRYKDRINKGEEPVKTRGRKPVPSIDMEVVRKEVKELNHCKKRTKETNKLKKKYKGIIPRRILNEMIIGNQ